MKEIIEKAVEGGFKWVSGEFSSKDFREFESGNIMVYIEDVDTERENLPPDGKIAWRILHPNDIIFSHDFLRCYFKDEPEVCVPDIHEGELCTSFMEAWQHHAERLVLSEDRIKYLSNFIGD